MASLTISNDAGTEKFALEAGAVTLGRGLESDIRLKDIKSSRRHCQVVKATEGYKLVDLGSGNGTYVNGILVDREHKLRNGDQIQIGGTTITFTEAAPAVGKLPTSSKPPTEADRKAAKDATSRVPAVPATSRTTSKTAPTAVTKKTTAAAVAGTATPGKKTTNSIPVAGTGRVTSPVKPSTSRIQAAGSSTTRRGGTGKVPTASISKTTKRTMTERYAGEIGKKKTNPMIFLIGGAVLALVAIVAVLMFVGGDDLKFDRAQIKELTEKGATAINRNEFDEGVKFYEQALALAQKHKELGPQVKQIEESINAAKQAKSDRETAHTDWDNLKKAFKESKYSGNKEKIKEMLDRIISILNAHEPVGFPWTKADAKEGPEKSIKAMKEVVDAEYKEALAEERRSGFQSTRKRIEEEFLMEGKQDFAGALGAWQKYIETAKDSEGKTKGPNELVSVNRRAFGEWDRLRKKADGKVANGDKEGALKDLEDILPRFAGCKFNDTDIEAEIKAKIADLKK